MNLPAVADQTKGKELEIFHSASIFDVARFEQVDRVADVMAAASLIPDHLKGKDFQQTKGNCFLICNLAATWELDPFAVAQASSLVFGKIVLEGKLVRAVIKKHLGFDLNYRFFGTAGKMDRRVYVSDRPLVDADGNALDELAINDLTEGVPDWRITRGTLEKWHTRNKSGLINDNWAKDEDKMFRERGSREWCREFEPGLMLGVYTPDEFDEVEHTSRSNRARDITDGAHNPLTDKPVETMDPKTGEFTTTTSGAQSKPQTKPAEQSAGGTGKTSSEGGRSQPSSPSSSAPKPAGDDVAGGEAKAAPYRLSAEEFRAYSSALARMNSEENIKKADAAHWQTAEVRKPHHADDRQLCTDIFRQQQERAAGKIELEYLNKALEGWIADVVGGAAK